MGTRVTSCLPLLAAAWLAPDLVVEVLGFEPTRVTAEVRPNEVVPVEVRPAPLPTGR